MIQRYKYHDLSIIKTNSNKQIVLWLFCDAETGVLTGIPVSAMCVQRLDDSLNLQFTLSIAVCYVLHRCENQEIRC
ncbi:hypothetical protein J3Q64DRAFT_1483483 [Phycomyces blakesleeanus]|uniref:Uncharacterized protein n=1 Tax=Phycomyces blakesleeanus TaxID=4837 RepID=A0ABR3B174_PHYBL